MIFYKNNIFCLSTTNTSYVIRIDETKHVLLEYYGNKINEQVSLINGVLVWAHLL